MPTLKDMAKQPPPSTTAENTVTESKTAETPADTNSSTVEFSIAWTEYITDLKNSNKRSLLGILDKGIPAVAATNSFTVTAPHKVAADMLEEEKQDMLVFLRRRTGNPALNLVIEISQTEISALPYTSKEKFESMADKNPKLRDLRNALDLEIE